MNNNKKSIYHYDKGRIFRPNQKELNESTYYCPKCKSPLERSRNRSVRMLHCRECGFMIEKDNLLDNKKKIDEYVQKKKDIDIENSNVLFINTNKIINEVLKEYF